MSSYRGKTVLDAAEHKRVRKVIDEVKLCNEWEDSLSAVMKAARIGDHDKVKALIRTEGELIHYRDFNNGSGLYWAIVCGSEEIFRELIRNGLDPLMRTRKNENLLHVCAMYGAPQFVSELINKHGVDPKLEDSTKKTPLDRSDPFLCPTAKIDTIFS